MSDAYLLKGFTSKAVKLIPAAGKKHLLMPSLVGFIGGHLKVTCCFVVLEANLKTIKELLAPHMGPH